MNQFTKENMIDVGKIIGPHGIKGEVILISYREPPEEIFAAELYSSSGQRMYFKLNGYSTKGNNNAFICSCKIDSQDCTSRNHAETLRNLKVFMSRHNMQPLDDGEFYIRDLIGLKVIDQSGAEVGVVHSHHDYGAGCILEINFSDGSSEMYPFTNEIFPVINASTILFRKPQTLQ